MPMREDNPLRCTSIDTANFKLKEGHASKADAEEYVKSWNECGKHLGIAWLHEYTRPLATITLTVPEIRLRYPSE